MPRPTYDPKEPLANADEALEAALVDHVPPVLLMALQAAAELYEDVGTRFGDPEDYADVLGTHHDTLFAAATRAYIRGTGADDMTVPAPPATVATDCTRCGTSIDDCDELLLGPAAHSCCGHCNVNDTHNDKDPAPVRTARLRAALSRVAAKVSTDG